MCSVMNCYYRRTEMCIAYKKFNILSSLKAPYDTTMKLFMCYSAAFVPMNCCNFNCIIFERLQYGLLKSFTIFPCCLLNEFGILNFLVKETTNVFHKW